MKIDQSKNQTAIGEIRSQISESADLTKFNTFLANYAVIDFDDAEQQQAMDSCCGGENCCKNVTFNTTVTTS